MSLLRPVSSGQCKHAPRRRIPRAGGIFRRAAATVTLSRSPCNASRVVTSCRCNNVTRCNESVTSARQLAAAADLVPASSHPRAAAPCDHNLGPVAERRGRQTPAASSTSLHHLHTTITVVPLALSRCIKQFSVGTIIYNLMISISNIKFHSHSHSTRTAC